MEKKEYSEFENEGDKKIEPLDLDSDEPKGFWISNLCKRYDKSVLFSLGVAYFMVGFREFTLLAVRDYFKHYLVCETV